MYLKIWLWHRHTYKIEPGYEWEEGIIVRIYREQIWSEMRAVANLVSKLHKQTVVYKIKYTVTAKSCKCEDFSNYAINSTCIFHSYWPPPLLKNTFLNAFLLRKFPDYNEGFNFSGAETGSFDELCSCWAACLINGLSNPVTGYAIVTDVQHFVRVSFLDDKSDRTMV